MTGAHRSGRLVLTEAEVAANTVRLKTDLFYEHVGAPVLWQMAHPSGWSASGVADNLDTARADMRAAVAAALPPGRTGGGVLHIARLAEDGDQ